MTISDREAWLADRIRKTITFVVSAAGTWLLLRVLFRLSQGRQALLDPELGAFVLLAIVATWWIRATRRMPRRPAPRAPDPNDAEPNDAA